MRHPAKPYYLIAILLVFLASCSKKSNVPVPADAALVLHINGNSLHSKFSWDEFRQSELYKLASKEAKDDLAQKILANPDSSGVDITSDAFFFVRMRGRSAYTGFTCAIKDEKAFAVLMQKVTGETTPVKTGDISVVKSYNAVYTWNKKRFVMIGNSPEFNTPAFGKRNQNNREYFTEDSLVKFASEVYTIKGSASVGSNDKFADMMKESGDMHFWMNPGKFYQGAMGAMLSLTKASILFEGNYAAATLNFDKGKIVIDGKNYANKELVALNKKYKPENLSEDMLKKIPAGNVNAAFAAKYSPEKLKELLVLLGVDGLANNYLGEVGYSLDELVQASNGDLLVSVSDFEVAEKETKYTIDGKEYSFKNKRPDAKLLFATSVKNKASFEKLLTGLKEKFGGDNDMFSKAFSNLPPYLLRDNWFLAGDSGLVHTYGSTSTKHAFISKIAGHPMGGYVDIQKFIIGGRNSVDSSAAPFFDESVKFWQDVIFYGGEYKNGAMESHFEINLVDKNTNSLKQMVSYLGAMLRSLKNETERHRVEIFDEELQNFPPPPLVDTIVAKP